MKIDNLLLNIGAMKAGTTWLNLVLSDHPDIYFTDIKEIHYFAHKQRPNALSKVSRLKRFKRFANGLKAHHLPENLDQLLDWYGHYLSSPINDEWYKKLFELNPGKKYSADFGNLHAHLTDAEWQHAKSMTDNLKVVYIMRHPLKRLWSNFKFYRLHHHDPSSFDNLSPEAYYEICKGEIWSNSEYSRVTQNLKNNLNSDQYLVAFFEDIHKAPRAWLKQLEAFLDVREHQYPDDQIFEKVNPSEKLKMPDFFPDLFKQELADEISKLEDQGYQIPESWNDIRN